MNEEKAEDAWVPAAVPYRRPRKIVALLFESWVLVEGDFTINLGSTPPYNQWHGVSVTRSLGGVGINDHTLNVVITKVTLKELDDTTTNLTASANSASDYVSLSDYVLIDQDAYYSHDYDQGPTNGSGVFNTQIKVIDPRVVSYELGAGDMSVAEDSEE